ncbi:glycosyl hydrolase [Paenibacillus swuensis]|uniref:Glycosyl hydrolase n=1 Tax=Paenibacillus swuensis TaxID=1178515 RepID=A0A172TDQ0_9BACL|nr:CARDB domain-containing protein [Paenibacillus swuensis]ANE45131.1 glycosyl hydrolase [Paenibacillus swuensis]
MRNKFVVWSLVFTMLISSLFLSIGTPATVSAAGGTNLTLGKNITASGQSQTYGPNNIKDSNQGTYWESTNNAFPQWIQVDLGTNTSIDQVVLKLPAGWEARTQTLAVQGSQDGSAFTDIVGSKGYVFNPTVNGNGVTINFTSISTRFVRLQVTGNTGWPAAQLAEFEIYGTGGTPPTTGMYQAESAALSGGAKVNTDHVGFSGTGFVDGYWSLGATTAFTVNVPESGSHGVTLKYANAGGNTASVSIYVNGSKIRQTLLPNLANWDTWSTKAETLILNAGNNTVAYKYDSGDNGNINLDQIVVEPVTTAPSPDLTITGLSWSPSSPVESSSITLNATVKNNGSAGSAATTVNFYLNNTLAGTAPVTALAAGASATVSLNAGTKSAGTYTVSAKVDENNTIVEQNDSNNSYTNSSSLNVNAVASADLTGTVSWSPGNPVANSAVTFTVNLKNQGNLSSASGSHGITVALKNSTGSTVQTLNGAYNGTLAAGASVNVVMPGTWTAVNGSYTVTTTVAADVNEVTAKQGNNVSTANLAVYSSRGASMPYKRYDTEDATRGGGATIQSAPTFDQALTASEASGQRYIALPSNGSYLQWTVRQGEGGAGVTMRFTMPDSASGMGLNGALDVYVNGTKAKTVSLTSYYSWQYFNSDHPADAPGGGRPLFRFDEVHWKLDTPLQSGDTIRIQKNNGDTLEYGVDFIEIEPVPIAIARPSNSISVADHGAVPNDGGDDLAAFDAAVLAAVASSKTLYIPAGTFHLGNMWKVGSVSKMIDDITIVGAGVWHTNLQFTNASAASGGISLRVKGKLDFSHIYMNSNLRSRYDQNAIYKGFMDNFGSKSKVHNVWVEHFECGFWVGDYAHTPAIIANELIIENSRIRNNLADGINFAQGTSNSSVLNSSVRNNGDDGLAVWTSNVNGAPAGVNNTFSFNTIENNWRAAAIAFFGGSGHKATHNMIIDTVGGSGFRMNTVFPGYHFQNNTGILVSDTTMINSGTSKDLYNGERGAIDLEASNGSIKNVTFTNIDILNTQRSAVQFGYGGGFENIVFNNININGTGLDGIQTSRFSSPHPGAAIYTYTGNGAATFNNLTTSNIAHPNKYFIQSGFNLIIQ